MRSRVEGFKLVGSSVGGGECVCDPFVDQGLVLGDPFAGVAFDVVFGVLAALVAAFCVAMASTLSSTTSNRATAAGLASANCWLAVTRMSSTIQPGQHGSAVQVSPREAGPPWA